MLGDTIAAVASPPGHAARGVIRVSGPDAFPAVARAGQCALPRVRGSANCAFLVRAVPVDALVLAMPAPASYTGEDVVELHLPGGPLLLDAVLAELHGAGARPATPGEFTRRAFVAGRLSLEQAEAVADLIAAAGESERRHALHALHGGVRASLTVARGALQDALATLESGLDFTEGETGAVSPAHWLPAVGSARDVLHGLHAALPDASSGGEVLLLGAANAGKSSLCNALAQREAVLVDATAGTTRDVIAVALAGGVTLLDAPGDLTVPRGIDADALALRDRIGTRAGGVLVVVDLQTPHVPAVPSGTPVLATVFTKLDLVPQAGIASAAFLAARGLAQLPRPHFIVSNVAGVGLDALHAFLRGAATRSGAQHGAQRWRTHLAEALAGLERVPALAAVGAHDELAAAELAAALAALDRIEGRSSPEDVLDRVFARFCLGK